MSQHPPTRDRIRRGAALVGLCLAVAGATHARAAEDADKRDEQLVRTRREVAAHPKSGPRRAQLAFLLYVKFQDGDDREALDEAVTHAARAVELSPDHEDVRRIAARCYLATDTADGRTKAREHAQAALRHDPSDSLTVGLLGLIAIYEGNYEQAKKYYQQRQKMSDDFYACWKWAYLHQEMGQGTKALAAVENAISRDAELTAHRADALALKAWILFDLGRYDAARDALDRSLALEPDNLSAVRGRAYLAKNLGQFDEAVRWYLKIPEARRHAIDTENIADAYDATGNAPQAERFYTRAQALYEKQVARKQMSGYNNLAYFLASRGREPERALRLARKAAEVSPRYHVFDTLAWALYRNGRYAEALKWQQKASVQPCDQAIWHFHMGMIQWKLGRLADARRSLRRALEISPNFHYLHPREARHLLDRRLTP